MDAIKKIIKIIDSFSEDQKKHTIYTFYFYRIFLSPEDLLKAKKEIEDYKLPVQPIFSENYIKLVVDGYAFFLVLSNLKDNKSSDIWTNDLKSEDELIKAFTPEWFNTFEPR